MLLNGLGIRNKVSSLTKDKINLRGDFKTLKGYDKEEIYFSATQ